MVDTDWRKILSFSQEELKHTDKEKLCENLSWMEADDMELNFTDLKSLFRLAQDILKYKSEQVNNLLGQLDTVKKKYRKIKVKDRHKDSLVKSDNSLNTMAHQEEIIKANKDILEQLYADIAELEKKKNKHKEHTDNLERESDSSTDALSEINGMTQLENEIIKKNRHIRKLLGDVKILEEENTKLKEKLSLLKDKLKDSTTVIEDLTVKLLKVNNECSNLKDILATTEQVKCNLNEEIKILKYEISALESNKENKQGEVKSKIQNLKRIIKCQKTDIETLTVENVKLKNELLQASKSSATTEYQIEEAKIKELQNKLSEASTQIMHSANLIDSLKTENNHLKTLIEDSHDISIFETNNESDDRKQKKVINKLKTKIKDLSDSLQYAENMIAIREKELADLTLEMNVLQSEESVSTLLTAIKNKKREIKVKDAGIKSIVNDINKLNETVNDLQIENEYMRRQLNINSNDKIPTEGIMKEYNNMKTACLSMSKELHNLENYLVSLEIDKREKDVTISKYKKVFQNVGVDTYKLDDIDKCIGNRKEIGINSKEATSSAVQNKEKNTAIKNDESNNIKHELEMQALIEENEGLRKGLEEIFTFLKDNSSSSGILSLECPSLEAILNSLDARHAAGWHAPHIATKMELKAAQGGKNALLTALHQSRKETFDIMAQLSKESQNCLELQNKLTEMEKQSKEIDDYSIYEDFKVGDYSALISVNEINDFDDLNKNQIEKEMMHRKSIHEQEIKNALLYFRNKFKILYDDMTSIAISAADEKSKWDIQEERYIAQIEQLKAAINVEEYEDHSDMSPGLITSPRANFLERKCNFLEESYKNIKILNENIKNELLERKKEILVLRSKYECQIHKLILSTLNLTNKLCVSIPEEIFWKQNNLLNELVTKYRNTLDSKMYMESSESITAKAKQENTPINDEAILHKQLQGMCSEIEAKNKLIEELIKTNNNLQLAQTKLIDDTLASERKEEINHLKQQVVILNNENEILKEHHITAQNQLDVTLLELKEIKQRKMNQEIEINGLRHEILDLQSTGDSKVIIARLSSEILVTHLQARESQSKVEELIQSLTKEKVLRIETEKALQAHQKIFELYINKYENKLRYMHEIMQILRIQYHGSLPLLSLEKYLKDVEELSHNSARINEQLSDIEDLRCNLIVKHSVYDQILEICKSRCSDDLDECAHKLQLMTVQGIKLRELDHYKNKLLALEKNQKTTTEQYNSMERNLIMVNQGFKHDTFDEPLGFYSKNNINVSKNQLDVEDVHSDDESSSRGSKTFSLPEPHTTQLQKMNIHTVSIAKKSVATTTNFFPSKVSDTVSVYVQTSLPDMKRDNKTIQTEEDTQFNELEYHINNLYKESKLKDEKIAEYSSLLDQRVKDMAILKAEKNKLNLNFKNLSETNNNLSNLNKHLQETNRVISKELDDLKDTYLAQLNKIKNEANEEHNSLLLTIRNLENDKTTLITEYKQLLDNEREEYCRSVHDLQSKITMLQSDLDSQASQINTSKTEIVKECVVKYISKNTELEDKCFKVQNSLDECRSELVNCQGELDRWKNLASERLEKMETIRLQLKDRYNDELESYKAENQHWLSQLNETQREQMELRSRMTELKAIHVKQLSEKDTQIEHLRSLVQNLKVQIMNMQAVLTANDPSFDLSAIVEVEEASDVSQQGSDKLQIKFDSTVDLQDIQDLMRMPATSTTIWQEPLIERLRREKHFLSKQNATLRRQIKALASRERRARLDAQNLKNQVFRISTSGSKAVTAESTALHSKIAALQAQLINARRETNSSVALWDKWKRAQQTSERWQARYNEKCQEVNKLEASLNLAKLGLARLEKEKRVLMSRLADIKSEKQYVVEKQDGEVSEKRAISSSENVYSEAVALPVPSQALLDRVEAQQRRIAALEIAAKGNEPLLSEYEKALAEITSLKGQVLKLESTLLEVQIRSPMTAKQETHPELEYWKSYCNMLKDENTQLTLRVNSFETAPVSVHQQKVNDLEQTVLTLRGLVSKLQAEQKSSILNVQKRSDSRPNSGHSSADKTRSQLESYRTEISNLKRSIQEKDLLLERSKDMLRIAAEREDELLRENEFLRRQLDVLMEPRDGSLSA